MKTIRRFNLFWIAVCLPSLLAVQTNALLTVHLADCCEHRCEDEGRSETPAEHQKHCHYCQFSLNITDKTFVELPIIALHVEIDAGEEAVSIPSCTDSNDIACTVCRGPPCA